MPDCGHFWQFWPALVPCLPPAALLPSCIMCFCQAELFHCVLTIEFWSQNISQMSFMRVCAWMHAHVWLLCLLHTLHVHTCISVLVCAHIWIDPFEHVRICMYMELNNFYLCLIVCGVDQFILLLWLIVVGCLKSLLCTLDQVLSLGKYSSNVQSIPTSAD